MNFISNNNHQQKVNHINIIDLNFSLCAVGLYYVIIIYNLILLILHRLRGCGICMVICFVMIRRGWGQGLVRFRLV